MEDNTAGLHLPLPNNWPQTVQLRKSFQRELELFVDWYNTFRPHQGLDNRPIPGPTLAIPPEDWNPADVAIDQTLGGVLHHCHWKNAA